MLITRISPISGTKNTREISVTEEEMNDWKRGTLIQTAMPGLTPDEREFIMTGITAAEWDAMFNED